MVISTSGSGSVISIWLKVPRGSSFYNNLKNLSLAKMLSWNFSSKPRWQNTFSSSWNLAACNIAKGTSASYFICILRTNYSEKHVSITTFPLSCSYKKSVINHWYKKWNKYFNLKKYFIMNLFKVNNKWTQTRSNNV